MLFRKYSLLLLVRGRGKCRYSVFVSVSEAIQRDKYKEMPRTSIEQILKLIPSLFEINLNNDTSGKIIFDKLSQIIEFDEGFIYFDESQHILFTEKGLNKAQSIYNRHRLLTEFLMKIAGVSEEQAEKNACRVEHVIDADIVAGIKSFMEKNSN